MDRPTYDTSGIFKSCPECGGRIEKTVVHVCPSIEDPSIPHFDPHFEGIATNGYICGCGQWVNYGMAHVCSYGNYDPGNFPVFGQQDFLLHQKIDKVLENQEILANAVKYIVTMMEIEQGEACRTIAEKMEAWIDEYQEKFTGFNKAGVDVILNHLRGWVDLKGEGESL